MGEGKHPQIEHLLKLALSCAITQEQAKIIIEKTQHSVAEWQKFARMANLSQATTALVQKNINLG